MSQLQGNTRDRVDIASEDVAPVTQPPKIRPGDLADPSVVERFFGQVKEDLTFLALADESLKQMILRTYNTVSTQENGLISKLKQLASKMDLIKLYSDLEDRSKTYNVIDFAKQNSVVNLEKDRASLYQTEGSLTLPIVTMKIVPISGVKILSQSDGLLGNNEDRTRPRHSNIDAIRDSDINSWFEYEKLVGSISETLTLALELTLSKPTILNRLEIDLLDLGLAPVSKIKSIKLNTTNGQVSLSNYTQIADKVGLTFIPSIVSSITIEFFQDRQYPISPNKVRYVIGIREITLFQIEFAKTGKFETPEMALVRPLRAFTMQDIVLADDPSRLIQYEYSVDQKTTWLPISIISNIDSTLTEAVQSDDPIQSLAIKGTLTKDESLFEGSLSSTESNRAKELLVTMTDGRTNTLELEAEPKTFCEVIRIGLGAVGSSANPFFAGKTSGGSDISIIDLPVAWPRELLHVLVNGEEWAIRESFSSKSETGVLYDETSSPPQLVFGDGLEPAEGIGGRKPPQSSEIYVYLSPDTRGKITHTSPYEIELSYPCDKIKQTTKVVLKDTQRKTGLISIGPGQRNIDFPRDQKVLLINSLENEDETYAPLEDGDEDRDDEESSGFRNGRIEFNGIDANKFTTDWHNNILHFSPASPLEGDNLVLEYDYIDAKVLPEEDWDFHPERNSIVLNGAFFGLKPVPYPINEVINSRRLKLTNSSIIKGTISIVDIIGGTLSGVLETEVPYQNGAKEFAHLGNTAGFYSVDYSTSYIYIPEGQAFQVGSIQFSEASVELEYGLGQKLANGRDFIIDKNKVVLSTAYVNNAAEQLRNRPARGKLLIRYDTAPPPASSQIELARFYSPVLKQIQVNGVTSDPRLGTIETL